MAYSLLFVDDESGIRLTLPEILKREGFEVTTAATVPQALEYIAKEKFDVLLADLNIGQPGDGFTVVSAMRRTQPEAVTLILTGYPDFDTALQALRAQVDDYFTKPADIKQLVSLVRGKLEAPVRKTNIKPIRVSLLLRDKASDVIEKWFEAVSSDRQISRIPLSKAERINHLPAILREVAERVESGRLGAGVAAQEAASIHGRQRREHGYSISQILIEARILHGVISTIVQDHLLSVGLSTFTSDVLHIGESLHEQLEWSIRAFLGATRILAISFDLMLEETRALVLRQAGYDVTSAVGADDGKQIAQNSRFDLFIVGNSAPYKEREELLKWLRSRFTHARILMLTMPHEGSFPGADYSTESGDPQRLLDAIEHCASLIPRRHSRIPA